ncbi:GtrA family protein [Acidisoma silvae]|uniref:GtrA family protein n=1 Tax=Acidisoma silvae TaxID=2802396 RepID=A0A964E1I2_9PROT|nr:GtrA family protein [Acidisoma silvae]
MRASEFVRFIVTGGCAACVNILVRIPLGLVMSYSASIIVAYLIGMTTAFLLAKLFVFQKSERASHAEFARFAIVNLVALLQVWLVSLGLKDRVFPWFGFTWHAELVAHAIGVASPVVTSYYGHKLFTFKAKNVSV